jgi:hypothetical protein
MLAVSMRLSENEIEFLARKVVKTLVKEERLEVDDEIGVTEGIAAVITEEMRIEDRLNEEVREKLVEYSSQMADSNITYNEMFKMVKRKLAKEKGIIL